MQKNAEKILRVSSCILLLCIREASWYRTKLHAIKSAVCHGLTILSADFLGQINHAHKSWPTLSNVWHPLYRFASADCAPNLSAHSWHRQQQQQQQHQCSFTESLSRLIRRSRKSAPARPGIAQAALFVRPLSTDIDTASVPRTDV